MSEEKMLPCPFCGCIAPEMRGASPHHLVTFTVVWCPDCHMQGPRATDEYRAIHGWNALPRALRWTKEPPKELGWYLWREDNRGIVRVTILPNLGELRFYAEKCVGEWAGPIPEPKAK